MSLVYGFEPVNACQPIVWRPMRAGKTYYAGQLMQITSLGSVATAAAANTAVYGVLAKDNTTTATETTTKVPVYVFAPGARFVGRTKVGVSAGERYVGSVVDFAISTTSRYRIDYATSTLRNFQILELDSRDSGTAAGRRVIFTAAPAMSTYIGVGRRA